MSRFYGWALALTIALSGCLVAERVMAQNPPPSPVSRAPAGPTVALVDIGYIFKNSQRFKTMMEELKADVERIKAESKAQRAEINELGDRLRQYRNGTPDYQALEGEIAKRQAQFTATSQLRGRDIARREAKIWLDVYREICDATNDYMQRNNIDMVMRFNGDPVDPEEPDSVREFLARSVISHRSELDITPAILQSMNRGGVNRPVPGGQQGGPYR
jgi:Skp family chaperone for outer membrane proteins